MDSFRNIRDDGIIDVPTAADRLALLPKDGDLVQQLDTHSIYSYDGTTETWILISQPAVGTLVTSVFGRVGDIVAESGDYSGDQISQDSTHRFVTDTEKTTWNAKEDVSNKVTNLLSPNNTTYPTTLAVSTSVAVVSDAFADMKEPNGFVNRTDSTMSFDHTTRIFTIAPVTTSYSIYVASIKRTITTSKTVTIPNTTGTYYFYIDSVGTLSYTNTFDTSLISVLAYCALIYWDASGTGSERVVTFGDERHGITMDGQTHAYLHTTRGAVYGNGCGLTGFTINAGNTNADAQFTALSGLIWDEDIKFDLSSQATFPILYRSNGSWKRKNADSFSLIYDGVGYTGTRPAYNLNTAGVWSLAEVPNTQYFLIHIFATNDINTPFIGILGQNHYNNGPNAQAGALTEIYTIAELPLSEFCPIGSVIFQTSNSMGNTPKAKVVAVSAGVNFVDFRLESVRPGVLA